MPRIVATYDSFLGDSGTAERRTTRAWVADHDVEVAYTTPNAGSNEVIHRKQDTASNEANRFDGPNTHAPVTFTSEGLAGTVEAWTRAWAQQSAAN